MHLSAVRITSDAFALLHLQWLACDARGADNVQASCPPLPEPRICLATVRSTMKCIAEPWSCLATVSPAYMSKRVTRFAACCPIQLGVSELDAANAETKSYLPWQRYWRQAGQSREPWSEKLNDWAPRNAGNISRNSETPQTNISQTLKHI